MVGDDPASIRMLHVDDDPDFGDLVVKMLENKDGRIDVTTESTVAKGLARLRDASFDCIVSDYDLPDSDGLEFLRTVREDYPNLPFIFFTGKGTEEVAADAISAGVTDYLQKQSGIEQYTMLINRIRNAVSRQRAMRQIELSHRAMETATEGLSLVQPDGTFSYVNPAFAQLFGHKQNELIGADWTVLYHNSEAKRLETEILPAVRKTGYWAGETVRLTKQGDRLVTDHRLSYTNTEVDVIVCTAQDVTEERRLPTDGSTPFDLLVNAMDGDAFYTLDHEGYLTRWNERAAELFGYEAAEVLGQHLSVFFSEEDRHHDVPERLLDTASAEGTVTDTRWQLHRDGSRLRAEVMVSASYDDTGTLVGFGIIVNEASDPPTDGREWAHSDYSRDPPGKNA